GRADAHAGRNPPPLELTRLLLDEHQRLAVLLDDGRRRHHGDHAPGTEKLETAEHLWPQAPRGFGSSPWTFSRRVCGSRTSPMRVTFPVKVSSGRETKLMDTGSPT